MNMWIALQHHVLRPSRKFLLMMAIGSLPIGGHAVSTGTTAQPADAQVVEIRPIMPIRRPDGLGSRDSSVAEKMSEILGVPEQVLAGRVGALHDAYMRGQPVSASVARAKLGVLIDRMIPDICSGQEGDYAGKRRKRVNALQLVTNVLEHEKEKLGITGMPAELAGIDKRKRASLPGDVLLLMAMAEIACSARNMKGQGGINDIDSMFIRSGIQPGTLVVRDPADISNPFFQQALQVFGRSEEQWEREKREALEEYEEKGYVEVDDAYIGDLAAAYARFKGLLKSYPEVTDKLAYVPSEPIRSDGFRFLAAEPSDVETSEGYTGVVYLYETSAGLLSVEEKDLSRSGGVIMIEPEALNLKIGRHPASLSVLKGRRSGKFLSEIFWQNQVTGKAYSVEVNVNLNDASMRSFRERLLEVLAEKYGGYH